MILSERNTGPRRAMHVEREERGFLRRTDRARRKRLAQYFTPAPLRDDLVGRLSLPSGARVLDPAVGAGGFLRSCEEDCPGLELHGWDVDRAVLDIVRRVVPHARLVRRDALTSYRGRRFDAVVGNPPYFYLPDSRELRARFGDVIGGRPNIFALFFRVGLDLLRPGGRLAFVVPTALNTGAYFEPLRRTIARETEIEHLGPLHGDGRFRGAQQTVQLLVLRKGARGRGFQVRRSLGGARERLIFHPRPAQLRARLAGRRTLHDLGYRAVTGTVVWNQSRDRLRREPAEDTLTLVQAHNLVDGELVLMDDHERPQYVVDDRPLVGPAIVLNRIAGVVGFGEVRAALIPAGARFVGENHVNVVLPRPDAAQAVSIERLFAALRDPRLRACLSDVSGNTQVSATELNHLLPLDC
jgi:adenine-specific DNA-methyltransferase